MKTTKLYYALGAACLLAAALMLATRPDAPLFTSLTAPQAAPPSAAPSVGDAYKISFAFTDGAAKAPAFIPKYGETSFERAREFAAGFGLDTLTYYEDEETWVFSRGGESLAVPKYECALRYTNSAEPQGEPSAEEATRLAEDFLRGRALPLQYQTADAVWADGGYVITFAPKLGPFTNRAFPPAVTVRGGAVAALEYYYYDYERLSYCGMTTMREAFAKLPVNEADGRVDLRRCSLVYIYLDSILQPAYMFEGETEAGEARRYTVPAGSYWE